MSFTWLDGKFTRSERAQINILSHALHYGTGVFEGIRAYKTDHGPAIFRLQEHVDRLFRSAAAFGVKMPYKKSEIAQAIKATIARNGLEECYIRPIVFFGEGSMGLLPDKKSLRVAISAWPWGAYLSRHHDLSVGISSYIRFHPRSVVPGAKITGFYATSALATVEARKHKFDECILLDHEGYVSEGPGENLFMVKNKKLFTPNSASMLAGITRDSVMVLAKDMRIPVFEKKISLKELFAADEVFFAGTAAEIAPVKKINNRLIGKKHPHSDIAPKIRTAYLDAAHGMTPRYEKWLSYVK